MPMSVQFRDPPSQNLWLLLFELETFARSPFLLESGLLGVQPAS